MTKIEVARDVREENRNRSDALRAVFNAAGVRAVGILGSPGSGKTTLLENILPRMKGAEIAVIEGDVATDNDARRLRALGVTAAQIETGGACHLDSDMVERTFAGMDIPRGGMRPSVLIIENVGNLVCPVAFPVGEEIRIAVISAAEGEDKPMKYPSAVLNTDAIVITKTDIARFVRVDPLKMAAYAKAINPNIRVFFAGYDDAGQYFCRGENGGESIEEYIIG